MGMASVFKVIEYKPDPKQKGVGAPPQGKLIQEYSGRNAAEKANALRDKLNKNPLRKGHSYFVKGDIAVPVRHIPSINLQGL